MSNISPQFQIVILETSVIIDYANQECITKQTVEEQTIEFGKKQYS
jgi:hypothetical protein